MPADGPCLGFTYMQGNVAASASAIAACVAQGGAAAEATAQAVAQALSQGGATASAAAEAVAQAYGQVSRHVCCSVKDVLVN